MTRSCLYFVINSLIVVYIFSSDINNSLWLISCRSSLSLHYIFHRDVILVLNARPSPAAHDQVQVPSLLAGQATLQEPRELHPPARTLTPWRPDWRRPGALVGATQAGQELFCTSRGRLLFLFIIILFFLSKLKVIDPPRRWVPSGAASVGLPPSLPPGVVCLSAERCLVVLPGCVCVSGRVSRVYVSFSSVQSENAKPNHMQRISLRFLEGIFMFSCAASVKKAFTRNVGECVSVRVKGFQRQAITARQSAE